MSNTTEILSYIKSLANTELNDSSLKDIRKKIRNTYDKIRDPKLYLALVGEFSSGKSTFINALLGFRLLKEAVMPTTACATYIESGGSVLTIDVVFFDGGKFHSTSNDFSSVSYYLSTKYKKNYTSLQDIIEDVTSDQMIARTVKDLHITIPNAKIPENIVLIDTPGFNPGAVMVENHYEITKHVVENVADAALILTSQEQAMSATLINFLNETLHRCLHRCLFVITMMDRLPYEHRASTIQYVHNRIVSDLNIQAPQLYAESAVTTLPVKSVPLERHNDWKYFQNEFKTFENALWENLQRNKEVVLKEHVNVLVKDIVVLCTLKIQDEETAIKKEKQFLESHKVESIQRVCNMMVSQSTQAIYSALNELNVSFAVAENNSKRRSDSIIDSGVMSISSFKDTMMPSIRSAVEEEARKQLNNINAELNRIVGRCVKSEINRMQRVFASHYDNFPALRQRGEVPKADLIKFNTPNMSFYFAISKIAALQQKEKKSAGIGAIAGGVLGFLVGGPIGAVAGAAIGGGGGAIVNDQSAQMRIAAKPIVRNEISSFFSSLSIKVDDEKNRIKSCYSDLIKHFADDHIRQYGSAIEQLIVRQREKISSLDDQIKNLKSAMMKLNSIQDDIELEMKMLRIQH